MLDSTRLKVLLFTVCKSTAQLKYFEIKTTTSKILSFWFEINISFFLQFNALYLKNKYYVLIITINIINYLKNGTFLFPVYNILPGSQHVNCGFGELGEGVLSTYAIYTTRHFQNTNQIRTAADLHEVISNSFRILYMPITPFIFHTQCNEI